MNFQQISEARSLALPYGQAFTDVDAFPQLQVQYVPELGTGGALATCVTTTATGLVFDVDGTTPAGKDVIGSSGALTFASYTTLGALADAINGAQAWRAILRGALRADASDDNLLAGDASCIGAEGLAIYGDADPIDEGSVAISGERFISNGKNGHVKDFDDACENSLLFYQIDVGATGNGTIKVYSEQQNSTSVQTLYSETYTDDAENIRGVSSGQAANAAWLTAPRGSRLIVRLAAVTSFDDIVAFHVLGKTAVLKGDRFVGTGLWGI